MCVISLQEHQQFYYIVGIRQLYPNMFAKVQLIGNRGIRCFDNHIHNASNPTKVVNYITAIKMDT